MRINREVLLPFLFLMCISITSLRGQFYGLETEQQTLLYFGEIHNMLVPHTARCVENSLNFHRKLFNYTPSEKITVLLHDFNDYGNAGADAVPTNNIVMGIAPSRYVYDTSPSNERINATMNHEMVHVLAMDKAAGSDAFYRSLFFGKVPATPDNALSILYAYLTTPRRYAPRWYHEGIAVFMETWMAGGLGRAQSAYDEMVFRTMVLDNSHFYDLVGLESEGTQIDFQVGVNSYLYGTRFMSYLAYNYTPEELIRWVDRSPGSKAYFGNAFADVFGSDINVAWGQWIAWEKEFQQENLEAIRRFPLSSERPLTNKALGSVSRVYHNNHENKLYAAIRYPGQVAHLAAIDLEERTVEKICDVKGAALYYVSSIAYDSLSGTIFYTTDNNDLRDLQMVNVHSGESQKLIDEIRVGDLAYNYQDQSLWGIRHYNGLSAIVQISPPYTEWNYIYSWPYGQDLFDIDISPDGKYMSGALIDIKGDQKLILMNIDSLQNENMQYDVLFDFGKDTPANFVFSSDGQFLYGTSYYSGVSNVFRYELARQDMSILTNCQSGYFRPLPVSEDSLLVVRYSGDGFIPVMIANDPIEKVGAIRFLGNEITKKHPVVTEWIAASPATINIDSLTISRDTYNTFNHIGLSSLYPVVEGYKEYPAFGLRFNLSDPVGLHAINLTASCSPNTQLPGNERLHLDLGYKYLDWELFAAYNPASFYDLFGPTKTSQKGYALGIQYEKNLIFDRPKIMDYRINLVGWGGLERLPGYQNIGSTSDKLLSAEFAFNYQYIRRSLGAVDDEKGFQWQIVPSGNYADKILYPRIHTTFDYGFSLPLNHSSIWLRSAAGYSYGKREEPFANYYFGGFGNNWVDHNTEKRYREYYSFPGVGLNAIGGTDFAKLMLEWNLPPIRFRNVGYASLYAPWLRTTLFTSGISTNLGSETYRRLAGNAGIQMDLKIKLLSHLNATFSLGFAIAWKESEKISDEFMISLKIL
ncbi:MAG: hypothetical protein E4H13_04730 [Calditrichales bacterium]|nr:MAG: hypothetical protein E4H13_04730 [Calditrichales bacterium]